MSCTFKFVKDNPTENNPRLTTSVVMPCVQLFLNQFSLPSGYPKLYVKHMTEKGVPCFCSIMSFPWLIVTGAGLSKSVIHIDIYIILDTESTTCRDQYRMTLLGQLILKTTKASPTSPFS